MEGTSDNGNDDYDEGKYPEAILKYKDNDAIAAENGNKDKKVKCYR